MPTGLWEAPRGDSSFDPTENRSGLHSGKANGWNADTDEGVGVAVTVLWLVSTLIGDDNVVCSL